MPFWIFFYGRIGQTRLLIEALGIKLYLERTRWPTCSLKASPVRRPGESSSLSWKPCELRMKVSTCSGTGPWYDTLAALSPKMELMVELLPVPPLPVRTHCKVWKHYQSTRITHTKLPQILIDQLSGEGSSNLFPEPHEICLVLVCR